MSDPGGPHDFERAVAEAHARFQVESLVGLPVEEARQRIEAVGGHFQAHTAGQAMTADFRTDRVRALIEDGRVIRASVG